MVLIKRSPQEIADFFNTDVYALKGDSGYAIANYKGISVLGCEVVDSNPYLDYNQGKVYHPNGSWLDKIKNRGMNNIFMKMTRDLIEKYSTSGWKVVSFYANDRLYTSLEKDGVRVFRLDFSRDGMALQRIKVSGGKSFVYPESYSFNHPIAEFTFAGNERPLRIDIEKEYARLKPIKEKEEKIEYYKRNKK